MFKIKKGDTVVVVKGKDLDKKGKVLKIFSADNRALVEGINMIKKHRRQTKQEQKGGIVSIEAPISISNLMILCKNCGRSARVGFKNLNDGSKTRFCRACKEVI